VHCAFMSGASRQITLRCLGFCGADDSVDPLLLRAISRQHEWVEWGVLFRPDKQGTPRYASDEWVAQLSTVNTGREMRLAAHLCAERLDEVLTGHSEFVQRMHEQVGFQRFQLNATASNGANVGLFGDAAGAARCVASLRAVMLAVPHAEFIVQRNAQTQPIWELLLEQPPSNLSLLFDESMGFGVTAPSWPPPPACDVAFGYAGGLSPGNISEQLLQMEQVAAGRTLWVDMESSLRTGLQDGGDLFDCNKAMACVQHVIKLGLKCSADEPPPPSSKRKRDETLL